jgi:hypothetical protein
MVLSGPLGATGFGDGFGLCTTNPPEFSPTVKKRA